MYDIELSNGTINAVTDKLLPELQAWRERDLEAIYPIVWLDAIHYKIKENGRYVSKAIYTILGAIGDTHRLADILHTLRPFYDFSLTVNLCVSPNSGSGWWIVWRPWLIFSPLICVPMR